MLVDEKSTDTVLLKKVDDPDSGYEVAYEYCLAGGSGVVYNENVMTNEEFDEVSFKVRDYVLGQVQKESNPTSKSIEFYSKTVEVNKETYYVCVEQFDSMNFYKLLVISSSYVSNQVQTNVLMINTSFFAIILLAVIVIYIWSTGITRRLRKIQMHVHSLPKNNYEDSYTDSGYDEIGELSKSIEHMRREINTNEKTKQEMLQNISHDLKTPVAVIRNYAEGMQDGIEDVDVACNKIIEQTEYLKDKVNKMLQYNRLEYFNHDKPFEDVNMTDLVRELAQNFKYDTNVKFLYDVDENIIFKGFKENWSIVIENIVDNARRYAKSKIKIILKANRLRIYNDGDHIDEKFINSSFKPYEKGAGGQFGLGMSIVQKTCDFFGYNLKVVNEEVGVSFIIEKPIIK